MRKPTSNYLKALLKTWKFSEAEQVELVDIEQFALYDVDSFQRGSIVMNGRRIDDLIKKYFKHYVAMVQELKGKEAAGKVRNLREHYMTVKPHIVAVEDDEDIQDAIDRLKNNMKK